MTKSTDYTKKLNKALKKRKIKTELGKGDGYKHVDITIPKARINIEVDGKHHIYSSSQLRMDMRRDLGSKEKGYHTIRIPNHLVKEDSKQVARSIAKVVASRKRKFKK